jgi:hypothetical protein
MPREWGPAAHGIGCRDALNWKAGGPDEVEDEIIRRTQEEATDSQQNRTGLAREVNDTLQVIRLRKQIDQVNLLDAIPTCQQDYQIARQGYRIA